jgi:phosphoribosyl 1,2-cyclic phosphodiesterase
VKIKILASSSEGNCTHIYTKKASILIDAGISAKRLFNLSGSKEFDAIFISHEHLDHVRGLGPIGRKTGAKIYIHQLVHKKIESKLEGCEVVLWDPGTEIIVEDLKINNFSTRHDSIYSYGFTIEETSGKKLGYLTDTGSWTKLMGEKLKGCSAYIIEADYDSEMLAEYEGYDEFLKERIASPWGHLGNDQTMELIKFLDIKSPEFLIFAHLSPRTNSPDLVLQKAYENFPDWDKSKFLIAPTEESLEL